MLPELDDTLNVGLARKRGLWENTPWEIASLSVLLGGQELGEDDHTGVIMMDGLLPSTGWALTALCKCHIVASLALGQPLRCGDHSCEVTAVNIHRDAHISFQGAQVTDWQLYLTECLKYEWILSESLGGRSFFFLGHWDAKSCGEGDLLCDHNSSTGFSCLA